MRYIFPLSPYNQQRQHQKPVWVYPVHLAMYATYLRDKGEEVYWGTRGATPGADEVWVGDDYKIDVPLNQLPTPDRIFTDAKNPRWQSHGNYKYHPATHIMSASGCWHGKCSFCFENGNPRVIRDHLSVADEVRECYDLGFKEIFDDAATIPSDEWCEVFYLALCHHAVVGKIVLGCNARIDSKNDFKLMKQIGYRMVLFGVESANQRTLDKINKGISADKIEPTLKRASKAGLEPHITIMFGYPWETDEDAMRTVRFVHYLLKKGYAKTVQASIFLPPRTIPDPRDHEQLHQQYFVEKVYDVYKDPVYWIRKIRDVRNWSDMAYLLKRIKLIKHAE